MIARNASVYSVYAALINPDLVRSLEEQEVEEGGYGQQRNERVDFIGSSSIY